MNKNTLIANCAHRRYTAPIAFYSRLALAACYVIALALVVRRTGEGSYEGVVTLVGVGCAYAAGVLSTARSIEPERPLEADH